MTGPKGFSPNEINETKKGDLSSKFIHNPIKNGSPFRPLESSNTLENSLYALENKNKQLTDIKRIKQPINNEGSQLHKARAAMIEINAKYEGQADKNPGDSNAKELADTSAKFLENLSILDRTDITIPDNIPIAIRAYETAEKLANDIDYKALEKGKIHEWGLNAKEFRTVSQIWQEITQRKNHTPSPDRNLSYDYTNNQHIITDSITETANNENKTITHPEFLLTQKGYQLVKNEKNDEFTSDFILVETWESTQDTQLTTSDVVKYAEWREEKLWRDTIKDDLKKQNPNDPGRQTLESWLETRTLSSNGYQIQEKWTNTYGKGTVHCLEFNPIKKSDEALHSIYVINNKETASQNWNIQKYNIGTAEKGEQSIYTYNNNIKKTGKLTSATSSDTKILTYQSKIRFCLDPREYYITLDKNTNNLYISNSITQLTGGINGSIAKRVKRIIDNSSWEDARWKVYSTSQLPSEDTKTKPISSTRTKAD